jgi:4-hydroxy-tetrahydrodipicolinate reductase
MNLAIVGYGKMGHLVEQLAPEYGFAVPLRLDIAENENGQGITRERFRDIDVAVDFSVPGAVLTDIERFSSAGVSAVIGTTGWTEEMDRAKAAVEKGRIGLVWSPNFSIGVNIFLRLVSEASRQFAAYKEYGAWAWEIHHATKKDAPSGT